MGEAPPLSRRFADARASLVAAYTVGKFDWKTVERCEADLRLLLAEKRALFRLSEERDRELIKYQLTDADRAAIVRLNVLYNSGTKPNWRERRPRFDMTGMSFGLLTVLGVSHQIKGRQYYWRVRCDCGVEKTVSGKSLRSGFARSCGCLRRMQSYLNAYCIVRDGGGKFIEVMVGE